MKKRQYVFTLAMMVISAFVGAMVSSGIVSRSSANQQVPANIQKWEYQIIFGGPSNSGYAISQLNSWDSKASRWRDTAPALI